MNLPFSQACENNKNPILEVLGRYLDGEDVSEGRGILEIGGGTGQHAQHFAGHLPWLRWQSSDLPENVALLNRRIAVAALPNLPTAISLDVTQPDWGVETADHLFTANSLHIMPAEAVGAFFKTGSAILRPGGYLFVYGPFRYQGTFTSESNHHFDQWLRQQDPRSGIRDFEALNAWAGDGGLALVADHAMPANNQLLVWRKGSRVAASAR